MTPSRLKAKLEGQTNVARKVFEVVPIQDAWSARQIYATLNEITRSTMDWHIFRGCLNTLKNAGLIKETAPEVYKRIEIKQKEEQQMSKIVIPPATNATQPEPASKNPIDLLSGISAKLRSIADDIDNAALVIDEGIAESAENLGKLKQLQSILKSLS